MENFISFFSSTVYLTFGESTVKQFGSKVTGLHRDFRIQVATVLTSVEELGLASESLN